MVIILMDLLCDINNTINHYEKFHKNWFNGKYYYDIFIPQTNYIDVLNFIKENRGLKLKFTIQSQKKYNAVGKGANRQGYQIISKQITSNLFKPLNGKFMRIDTEKDFWKDDNNIYAFTMFSAMMISCKCNYQYHFLPLYFELLTKKKLSDKEVLYFYRQFDEINFNNIMKLSSKEFNDLDIGFNSQVDFMKDQMNKIINESEKKYYLKISNFFEMFDSFQDIDNIRLDYILSGKYFIDIDDLKKCILFPEKELKPLWDKFLETLTQDEIKQMLITFGNTTSLNKEFIVYVSQFLDLDIKIETCLLSVTINKKFFENIHTLLNLKLYFVPDLDYISDYINNDFSNFNDDQYNINDQYNDDDVFECSCESCHIYRNSYTNSELRKFSYENNNFIRELSDSFVNIKSYYETCSQIVTRFERISFPERPMTIPYWTSIEDFPDNLYKLDYKKKESKSDNILVNKQINKQINKQQNKQYKKQNKFYNSEKNMKRVNNYKVNISYHKKNYR